MNEATIINTLKQTQRALGVITRDPRIRAWLQENDPQALLQADRAEEEARVTLS